MSLLLAALLLSQFTGCAHTQAPEPAMVDSRSIVGSCEVCVYVIENKQQNQPYLCRGLKDPNYQKNCVQVLESLVWWLSNEVYWLNYGCQFDDGDVVERVQPCPAHAVCSWIENLYTQQPFCPEDPYYKRPTQEQMDQLDRERQLTTTH